jgi:hypothetical protein
MWLQPLCCPDPATATIYETLEADMPPSTNWSVQTRWPAEPSHVGDARRFVEDRLLADRLATLVDTSLLIVSELATKPSATRARPSG